MVYEFSAKIRNITKSGMTEEELVDLLAEQEVSVKFDWRFIFHEDPSVPEILIKAQTSIFTYHPKFYQEVERAVETFKNVVAIIAAEVEGAVDFREGYYNSRTAFASLE